MAARKLPNPKQLSLGLPTAADELVTVRKAASDPARDLWFWEACGEVLCNRRTNLTPNWCRRCRRAFGKRCPHGKGAR